MPWSYAAAPPWVVLPRRPVVTIESPTGFSTSGFCHYSLVSCRGSPWVVLPRRLVVTIESTTGFLTSGFCHYALVACRGSPLGGAAAAPVGDH